MKTSWLVPLKVINVQPPVCLPSVERIGKLRIRQDEDKVALTASLPPIILKTCGFLVAVLAIVLTIAVVLRIFSGKESIPIVKVFIGLGILYSVASALLMSANDESLVVFNFKKACCKVVGSSKNSEESFPLNNLGSVGIVIEKRIRMRLLAKDETPVKEFTFSAGLYDKQAVYIFRLALLVCQRLKVPLIIDVSVPSENSISPALKNEYEHLLSHEQELSPIPAELVT